MKTLIYSYKLSIHQPENNKDKYILIYMYKLSIHQPENNKDKYVDIHVQTIHLSAWK